MTRPTIINDKVIKAFEEIVNDDINAIILTDEEMVLEVNQLLKKEDQFSYSAFKDWKAFALDKKDNTSEKNMVEYNKLRSVIKKALIKQKKHLFHKFREEPNQWQRWAWIIERKFDNWNIRRKQDLTSGGKPLPLLDYATRNNNGDKENTEAK